MAGGPFPLSAGRDADAQSDGSDGLRGLGELRIGEKVFQDS